jgi:hypothetical protein
MPRTYTVITGDARTEYKGFDRNLTNATLIGIVFADGGCSDVLALDDQHAAVDELRRYLKDMNVGKLMGLFWKVNE